MLWRDRHCAAWAAMHRRAFRVASTAVKERRGSRPTGVQAVATLPRLASHGYSVVLGPPKQAPLHAAAIDEPPAHIRIPMLDALPPEESSFYAQEESVVERSGKAEAVAWEFHQQYSFLGGSYEEWIKYLNRTDYAPDFWYFLRSEEVEAVSGVSAVPKKNPERQRKLLMSVTTN